MKHKLRNRLYLTYILFLAASFGAAFWLTPKLTHHYLHAVSQAEEYQEYLAGQSVAIQNVCYILLGIFFLLSLFPLLFFHFRFYRPLNKIILAAAAYTDSDAPAAMPADYSGDDELGYLCASLNYLSSSVNNSGEYQRKFISNISHDFRSPLTSIKGYVEAMLDGTIPPEMQNKYLGIVLNETERLNKLTEGLLLLNTFDDKGVYLNKTDFDLIPVIEKILATLEGTLQKKGLSVSTQFCTSKVMVNGDLDKIQQIFYNLLDNAIKFSYPDSVISLTVSERKKKVFVAIKDHGEGISKENLPKIWDRFYKTDTSRGRDKKGTGLGLSIVKEIIRTHGQNINVVSTEGVGTEFIFTLSKGSVPS